ncbi:MAG: metallophosphoesterase [Minisyncoccales bacterium]
MSRELMDFCKKEKILLNNGLNDLFGNVKNLDSSRNFLIKIKKSFNKNFISRELFLGNKEKVYSIYSNLSEEQKKDLDFLKGNLIFEKKEDYEKKEKARIENESPKRELESSSVKVLTSYCSPGESLVMKDFLRHFRARYEFLKNVLENDSRLDNLISIGKISSGSREKISVIGMVFKKAITKNKNFIFEVEDLSGKMKVLINKDNEDLSAIAEDIPLDAVLGFKGFGNNEILFVNEIIFPDTVVSERKKSPKEEYALFISDVHYGSENFPEKDFEKFINYLNEGHKFDPEVKKIKYLFIVGDLITGVGNYPNQERDLVISDLEDQFLGIATLLGKVRKDIQIIISPGNHDCVRLMEPQPVLDEKYAWPLYEMENVIVVENPSLVNIGASENFKGFDVLLYHGFSFTYYANNIPTLVSERTMNSPEKIMRFLLKHRHLAPTHGSVQYFPSEKDPLLLSKVPDIFVSGHTHKSGVVYHNNILVVSGSSWEGMTPYQEKFGNTPDHCKVPMINLKSRAVKILDFETLDKDEKDNEENKNNENKKGEDKE